MTDDKRSHLPSPAIVRSCGLMRTKPFCECSPYATHEYVIQNIAGYEYRYYRETGVYRRWEYVSWPFPSYRPGWKDND